MGFNIWQVNTHYTMSGLYMSMLRGKKRPEEEDG